MATDPKAARGPHSGQAAEVGEAGAESPTLSGTLMVPLLPLVENVVFPRSLYPLSLAGEQSESIISAAQQSHGLVALFLQRETSGAAPLPADLYHIGTLSSLSHATRSGDGVIDVTAEGLSRARLLRVVNSGPHAEALVQVIQDADEDDPLTAQLAQQALGVYRGLLATDPAAEQRLVPVIDATDSPVDLAYLIASTVPLSPAGRQAVLEMDGAAARLRYLLAIMARAHEMTVGRQPSAGLDASPTAQAARVPLSPAIHGPGLATPQATLDQLELDRQLAHSGLSPEAARAAERESERLATLTQASPDYNMIRTYLQWLADLPWRSGHEPDIDLERARSILDRDHYGLEDVKARIIEHLAVRKLRRQRSTGAEAEGPLETIAHGPAQPVLCLVGPPGVGKTSLGRSVAEALGRPFVRISLGGVSDEAEIRGHRRTYLGAMPGRIIQSCVRVKSNQPVMMLDELDKIGSRAKGDPTAALLDVLDPEQQPEFVDHYIEVPFDISCIFFIATANNLDSVPEALRDRLEVIRLSGYTEEEKLQIALRHILPRQMESHALSPDDISWEPEAVLEIIRSYTREAGVRQLEREIATICRRVATLVAQEGPCKSRRANERFVAQMLGAPRFLVDETEITEEPGIATGVFWTPVGGDVMHVEAIMMPGRKTLTITGQLGDVMRESAQAALSYVRAHAEDLGIESDFYERHDIHIHVPSGAVAKDGPSAGVTMAVALVSLLTRTPVPHDTAMSGELTLRGRVLPVGGIKEKVLAARRAGIRRVILPAQNRRDVEEIQGDVFHDLEVVFADNIEGVLCAAFPGRKHIARARRTQPTHHITHHAQMVDVPGAAMQGNVPGT